MRPEEGMGNFLRGPGKPKYGGKQRWWQTKIVANKKVMRERVFVGWEQNALA